jgi:hypothetical protein
MLKTPFWNTESMKNQFEEFNVMGKGGYLPLFEQVKELNIDTGNMKYFTTSLTTLEHRFR